MKHFRSLLVWLTALCMALALMNPGLVLAEDDNDDDDQEESVPVEIDDDDDDPDDIDDIDDDQEESVPVEIDDDAVDEEDREESIPVEVVDEINDDDINEDDDDVDDDIDDDDINDEVVFDDDDDIDDDIDDDDDDDGFDRVIENEAIIQLNPGVDANTFANRHGVTVLNIVPDPNIVLLNLNPNENDADEVQELMTDDAVIWAERNYTSQAPGGRPRYFFASAAGEPRIVDGPALPAGLEFNPAAACVTGSGVIVAVLDTGVDTEHPALRANLLPNGVNMIDRSFDVSDTGNGIDDDNDGQIDEMVGHGTHVSGTILQIAPDTNILPVKVLDSDGVGDTFGVMAGIHYAVEQDAGIINLSLGSTYDSLAIRNAVTFAGSQGVVVVAAAGNGNQSQPLEYPASTDSVISVAATTAEGDKAEYSNFNEHVDISAPGDNVASAYPGGLYTTASGTSMSTPVITGSTALILERLPDFAPTDVHDRLQSTASALNLTDPAIDGMLGAGEINLDGALVCSG